MHLFLFQQRKASRVLVNKGLFRTVLKIVFLIDNKYGTFLFFQQVSEALKRINCYKTKIALVIVDNNKRKITIIIVPYIVYLFHP